MNSVEMSESDFKFPNFFSHFELVDFIRKVFSKESAEEDFKKVIEGFEQISENQFIISKIKSPDYYENEFKNNVLSWISLLQRDIIDRFHQWHITPLEQVKCLEKRFKSQSRVTAKAQSKIDEIGSLNQGDLCQRVNLLRRTRYSTSRLFNLSVNDDMDLFSNNRHIWLEAAHQAGMPMNLVCYLTKVNLNEEDKKNSICSLIYTLLMAHDRALRILFGKVNNLRIPDVDHLLKSVKEKKDSSILEDALTEVVAILDEVNEKTEFDKLKEKSENLLSDMINVIADQQKEITTKLGEYKMQLDADPNNKEIRRLVDISEEKKRDCTIRLGIINWFLRLYFRNPLYVWTRSVDELSLLDWGELPVKLSADRITKNEDLIHIYHSCEHEIFKYLYQTFNEEEYYFFVYMLCGDLIGHFANDIAPESSSDGTEDIFFQNQSRLIVEYLRKILRLTKTTGKNIDIDKNIFAERHSMIMKKRKWLEEDVQMFNNVDLTHKVEHSIGELMKRCDGMISAVEETIKDWENKVNSETNSIEMKDINEIEILVYRIFRIIHHLTLSCSSQVNNKRHFIRISPLIKRLNEVLVSISEKNDKAEIKKKIESKFIKFLKNIQLASQKNPGVRQACNIFNQVLKSS
jgi:hypothetical protein